MRDLTDPRALPAERDLPAAALARCREELVRAVEAERRSLGLRKRLRAWLVTLGLLATFGAAAGSAGTHMRPGGEQALAAAAAVTAPLAGAAATRLLAAVPAARVAVRL